MHESMASRLLASRGLCTLPDAYVAGVRDELRVRVTRTVVNEVPTPEMDAHVVGFLRRLVAAKLRTRGFESELGDDAKLIVSELVTNALFHGDRTADVDFRFVVASKTVTIAVNGGAPYRPQAVEVAEDSESGRGLLLVALLAYDCGVSDGRTTTWCTLALPVRRVASC